MPGPVNVWCKRLHDTGELVYDGSWSLNLMYVKSAIMSLQVHLKNWWFLWFIKQIYLKITQIKMKLAVEIQLKKINLYVFQMLKKVINDTWTNKIEMDQYSMQHLHQKASRMMYIYIVTNPPIEDANIPQY